MNYAIIIFLLLIQQFSIIFLLLISDASLLCSISKTPEAPTQAYTDAELDLLALWFTLIKVLYVRGSQQTVVQLVQLLGEPQF